MPKVITGRLDGADSAGSQNGAKRRIALVVARFNEEITAKLLAGALRTLAAHGVPDGNITVVHVPGAVEIPLAAQRIAIGASQPHAVIALGAVIRGETSHYDYVCKAVTDGVMDVMLGTAVPVAFGVLTCDTDAQAEARCGPGPDNKGSEAAVVALEMITVLEAIGT